MHRRVQEDLKDGATLKVCNNQEMQKPGTVSRSEEETIQEEMNAVKLKSETPISSEKFPAEQVEKKTILRPNRKRIMIR